MISLSKINEVLESRYFPLLDSCDEVYDALMSEDGLRHPENEVIMWAFLAQESYTGEGNGAVYFRCDDCGHMVSDDVVHEHCVECHAIYEESDGEIRSCGRCESCCNHYECADCGDHVRSICEHCENGTNCCCNCTYCCDCNRLADCECGSGYCERHCDCNSFADEYESYGEPIYANATSKQKFNSKRLAGVEWEFNDSDNRDLFDRWRNNWDGKIHSDGSCGYEAVTPPMAGDNIANCLTELGRAISRSEVNSSCGLHVHVDTRDYSWHDMRTLLKVFAMYEPFFYLLAGQERLINTYCEPIQNHIESDDFDSDFKSATLALYLNTNPNYARQRMRSIGKKDGARYKSLNIMPWLAGHKNKSFDTTVEFRLHRYTQDVNRVIGWTQLCVRLVDWCHSASDVEINNLPKSALQGLSKVIAPDLKGWLLNRIKGWRQDTGYTKGNPRRVRFRNGKYVAVPRPERERRYQYDEDDSDNESSSNQNENTIESQSQANENVNIITWSVAASAYNIISNNVTLVIPE